MSTTYDVLIVGGGIVGLTAALGMAERHYKVAIIDAGSLKADTTQADMRVYAVNKASQNLLFSLGVWQHIDLKKMSPYDKMHVWDELSGAYIDFNSRSLAAPNLGAIIEEAILKDALLRQIHTHAAIHLFPDCAVTDVTVAGHSVTLTSGDMIWHAPLLMIADGAHSPTRQKLKVGLTTWPYHHHALVATVNTENPHDNTAYQIFKPSGPLALLPLVDPHQCSIVWSTTPQQVNDLMMLDEAGFNRELTKAFANRLGKLSLASTRHQFPLHMRHVKSYVGPGWLLLGDAAHTIHPLAGLGLNIGLADVASWLHLVDKHRGSLISNKLLGAYQRERKHAVWQTILLMEGFKRLFSITQAPITSIRGIGLRACNSFTPLKRLFMEHAAG